MVKPPGNGVIVDDSANGQVRAERGVGGRGQVNEESFIRLIDRIAVYRNQDGGAGRAGGEYDGGVLRDVIVGGGGRAVLCAVGDSDIVDRRLRESELESGVGGPAVTFEQGCVINPDDRGRVIVKDCPGRVGDVEQGVDRVGQAKSVF
jgi:hypothetical protein